MATSRRTCTVCGKDKPAIAFHRNQTSCKKCHAKQMGLKPARPNTTFSKGTKDAVLRRADEHCEKCGTVAPLQLHHMKPVCLRPDLKNSKSNLKALCDSCHKAEHQKPGMDHSTLAQTANRMRRELNMR